MKKHIIAGLVFAVATLTPLVICLAAATSVSATTKPAIMRCIGDDCSLRSVPVRTKSDPYMSSLQRSVIVGAGMAAVTEVVLNPHNQDVLKALGAAELFAVH
jgi:hypothetical protein